MARRKRRCTIVSGYGISCDLTEFGAIRNAAMRICLAELIVRPGFWLVPAHCTMSDDCMSI